MESCAIHKLIKDMCPTFTGLQPSFLIAFETQGESDNIKDQGTYVEFGLTPGFTLFESERYPIQLKIPMTVGLSADNYYEDANGQDHKFGFFDVGADFSMPINWVGPEYGDWTLSFGVHYLSLGTTTENLNDGDNPDREITGKVGISMSY
jgi:hypothetical protein